MDPAVIEGRLKSASWDLHSGAGMPGFVIYPGAAATYLRFGEDEGVEPFVSEHKSLADVRQEARQRNGGLPARGAVGPGRACGAHNYYGEPGKYEVSDGYLACGRYWGLYIDNNLTDYVTVFLGDLGKFAHSEQLHGKSHNVAPDGEISDVARRRSLLGTTNRPRS